MTTITYILAVFLSVKYTYKYALSILVIITKYFAYMICIRVVALDYNICEPLFSKFNRDA